MHSLRHTLASMLLEKETPLTKEIVLDWCNKQPHEAQANQCARASVLRQFSKYLDVMGLNAYILPKGLPERTTVCTLHFFNGRTDPFLCTDRSVSLLS